MVWAATREGQLFHGHRMSADECRVFYQQRGGHELVVQQLGLKQW